LPGQHFSGNVQLMNVVLISTYELGHQPFGLASPAAWLQEAGATVHMIDLAIRPFAAYKSTIQQADLIAFYLPMHTATRLATAVIQRSRQLNPTAHLCAYGLYAPVNEAYLRELGVQTILGGEFEQGLVDLYTSLANAEPIDLPLISLARQQFKLPQRATLPELAHYARLQIEDDSFTVGYTEASRGCKHHCRHCPIVPVYNGRFRIIQPEIVLADIRQQVAAGAEHITFGDPDFLNGPKHALDIVQKLHAEFPHLTYDVTIKIEHLLKHADLLPRLRDTGCLFVTSAAEAVDDAILDKFDKGHNRADFIEVVDLFNQIGLALKPTFVAFTPWTTAAGYADLLVTIANLDLVDHVSPIQYAIRLLIPAGSKLLALAEVQALVRPFAPAALSYPWSHPDPDVDALYETIYKLVSTSQKAGETNRVTFERIWQTAVANLVTDQIPERRKTGEALAVPTLSEDWY